MKRNSKDFDKTFSFNRRISSRIALEAPFSGKNVQSMLKLGRDKSVAMAASLHRKIPITEYSPKSKNGDYWKRKRQQRTSCRNATKSSCDERISTKYLDASDGLAVSQSRRFVTVF